MRKLKFMKDCIHRGIFTKAGTIKDFEDKEADALLGNRSKIVLDAKEAAKLAKADFEKKSKALKEELAELEGETEEEPLEEADEDFLDAAESEIDGAEKPKKRARKKG